MLTTKLAVFMLDSYEMAYVQHKDRVPAPHRVGEVYALTVPFGLPVPSAKGYYWFYTGDGRPEKLDTLKGWPHYRAALRHEDICFWNKTDRTFGIFGFPLEAVSISDNVKYFQSIVPLSVNIRPTEWGEKHADEIKMAHKYVCHDLNNPSIAQQFIGRSHELYKKMVQEYNEKIDVMLFYYNLDWFSHRYKGPQLLDKMSWVDSLVMEMLDLVETENVIMFSEHGANHSKNCIFSSTYNFKPESFGEVVDFIHEKARNV